MKTDSGIWNKLTRLAIALVLIAGLLGVAGRYLPLIRQNERMRREVQRLDNQTQKESEIGRQLKSSIDALRNDPKAVERLTREQLGYVRTGEVVVHFEPAGTNRDSAKP